MVGAGFSRNAFSLVPDGYVVPTLDNLTDALSQELLQQQGYNDIKSDSRRLIKSDAFSLLAQEYEVMFGRNSLNQFFLDHIRDDQMRPSDVHKRLLTLPWRDVFTTNWDTLLEKSRDLVIERKYSILRIKEEIPLSISPRIVKLHGSFPAHFPLICTQEDYRTYPVKFSPFVNTVQQAMMETVLLLVGFSGDDPNFIHWAGWVRDNLGESAPKIYLAGWLNLSLSQRRVLAHRNVVAIDLAQHPKAHKWPEHQRHEYAIKWILRTLERAQPYKVEHWPTIRSADHSIINDDLQPVVDVTTDMPKKEPGPNNHSSSEDLSVRVKRIIQIWAHNRKSYPGWIAIPVGDRKKISDKTDLWEPEILKVVHKFDLVVQLHMIHELIWRREMLLDPISIDLESLAQNLLQKIDCTARTVAGESLNEIDWINVRQNYRNVMLTLTTSARLRFDKDTFEERLEVLKDFQTDTLDVAHRIHHERCLWAVYSLDYKSLIDLLDNWSVVNCDTIWMARKASLLYEINRIDEADQLIGRALSKIRMIPDHHGTVPVSSREGWYMELASVIKSTIDRLKFMRFGLDQLHERRQKLAPLKCDISVEIRSLSDVLKSTEEDELSPAFDLNMKVISGFRISNTEWERWKNAHRAIRLSEVAAIPIFNFNTLKIAAEELSLLEPELSLRMILRISLNRSNDLIGRILTRPQVAVMPVELARTIVNICNDAIKYALPQIKVLDTGGIPKFWAKRMAVAMEILSRLVIRLESEEIEKTFNNAVKTYDNELIIQNVSLHQSLWNVLKRSWHALPQNRKDARILDFLSAPILGIGNIDDPLFVYPNPGDLLGELFTPPERTDDNESLWNRVIRQLILDLNKDGNIRVWSSIWIYHITLWGLLTNNEPTQVASALWNEKYTELNGLPKGTNLDDWKFIVLPEPEIGLAERCFRKKYFSDGGSMTKSDKDLGEALVQVGRAMTGLRNYGKLLTLSEREEQFLMTALSRWTDLPMPSPKNTSSYISFHYIDKLIINEINGVSSILLEVNITSHLAEKFYQKMNTLIDLRFPAFGFIPSLSMVLKNRSAELIQTLKLGMLSPVQDIAEVALISLNQWIFHSNELTSHIDAPPDELIHEVGIMIAIRRKNTLRIALHIAKLIFEKGSNIQKQKIQDMTLRGLSYLLEELRYDWDDAELKNDLPDLRNYSVQLALSMLKHGILDSDTIRQWIQTAKSDPLPELRNAVEII